MGTLTHLCAGTGSATQAFIDRGHEVHKLDIEDLPGQEDA